MAQSERKSGRGTGKGGARPGVKLSQWRALPLECLQYRTTRVVTQTHLQSNIHTVVRSCGVRYLIYPG